MPQQAWTDFQELIVKFSGILPVSWHDAGSLKLAMMGVFTPQKLAKATNEDYTPPSPLPRTDCQTLTSASPNSGAKRNESIKGLSICYPKWANLSSILFILMGQQDWEAPRGLWVADHFRLWAVIGWLVRSSPGHQWKNGLSQITDLEKVSRAHRSLLLALRYWDR